MDKDKNKPHKSTLRRMTPQLDNVMDIFRHIESSDISGIRARNPKGSNSKYASTGYGYYQVIEGTLGDVNRSVTADGLKPLTLNSREEQHEAMRRLIISYDEFLRNDMGVKNPTIADYYGVHFNGPAGYKKIKQSSDKDSIKNYVTNTAKEANPDMYSGSINDYYKKVNAKITKAQSQLKKETPNRKAALHKEKTGFDNGTSTPIDLRQGEYKGDGREVWDPNKSYFNGTKLGEQNFDYVISKADGKAKVLKANSTNQVDIEGDYKPLEYDYSKNLYDPNLDMALPNTPDGPNYQIQGTEGYGGNSGFGADLFKIQDVDNAKPQQINYAKANRKDIATIGTALYNNPNNPGSAVGNQDHLKVNVDGKMIPVDAQPLQIDSAVTQAQDLLAANPTIPRNNASQQYKLGGDMTNKKVKNQNNDSLISFDAGGSHEENPLGGIPQNVNPDGTQNTVEQGETKHKDYVFSDSITILPAEAEDLMLPEDIEGMSYADASKFLNKALEENENDPIVKRTVERQLENLKAGNEKARLKVEEQQLADQEYEANLQADKIAEEQNANQGNVPSESSGSGNFSPTGEVNSSVPQQFSLDGNVAPNVDPNEQLLQNDSLPQQYELGGKMLANGGYDNGLNEWNSPYLTGQGNPAGYNQTTYNLDGNQTTSNQNLNDSANALGSVAGSVGGNYGQAASGLASGGIAMKEAFTLKDKVENGEKIDKGQVALKGAAAGATIGGTVGSVVPVIGTAIGAAAGAVIGGVSGLVVGNSAQKKAERRRYQLDKMDLTNSISDFRTGSGYMEGDTKEFATGGDLKDPYNRGTGITYSNFDDQAYYDRIANPMNFSLDNDNAIYDDTTLDDLVINTTASTPSTPVAPVISSSTAGQANKQDAKEKKAFSLPGGNVLEYAGLYGAYDQMKRLQNKPNWEESYVSSGLRYDPQFVDENLMANQIRAAGRTTDRTIQDNANGSGAAARAGLIASAGKTGEALSDAYIKTLEFNNAQKQFALQNDNQLLANRDAVINRQTENNMNNEQAEYRLEQSARNNWYNSLAAYGRESANKNIVENMTGYDIYGNRTGNSRTDQITKKVLEYLKNNNSNNQ